MNRKIAVTIAAVSLAIALIFPIFMVVEASNEDFSDLIHRGPLLDETDIQSFLANAQTRHNRLYTILAIAELVLVAIFVIALWLSLKT